MINPDRWLVPYPTVPGMVYQGHIDRLKAPRVPEQKEESLRPAPDTSKMGQGWMMWAIPVIIIIVVFLVFK